MFGRAAKASITFQAVLRPVGGSLEQAVIVT